MLSLTRPLCSAATATVRAVKRRRMVPTRAALTLVRGEGRREGALVRKRGLGGTVPRKVEYRVVGLAEYMGPIYYVQLGLNGMAVRGLLALCLAHWCHN